MCQSLSRCSNMHTTCKRDLRTTSIPTLPRITAIGRKGRRGSLVTGRYHVARWEFLRKLSLSSILRLSIPLNLIFFKAGRFCIFPQKFRKIPGDYGICSLIPEFFSRNLPEFWQKNAKSSGRNFSNPGFSRRIRET